MSVIIDVPNLHTAFEGESVQLNHYLSSLDTVKGHLQMIGADGSLTGMGYSAMKRYFLNITSPLIDYVKTAVETKKSANENAVRCLENYLGGEGVINVQQLTNIYNSLHTLRQKLESLSSTIEEFTSWIPGLGQLVSGSISVVISTVRKIERLYKQKLENVYNFMQSTEGIFSSAENSLGIVRSGLAAAQAAYSGIGQTGTQGASVSSGDPYATNGDAVKEWAKQTGQEEIFNTPSQEVLDWLNSLEGTTYDFDAWAGLGLQCFDLFIAYLDKLGFPRPQVSLGGANRIDDYIRNHPELYPGWSVIDSPNTTDYRVGDVLIWEDGDFGHVAIVVAVYPDGSYEYVDYNGTGRNDSGTRHKSTDNRGAHKWNGVADHICRPSYNN